MSPGDQFEALVEEHYRSLYRFAYTLVRNDADAADLTQEAFYIWAKKGDQLQDPKKAKAWLFRTLHREFLQSCRHRIRFPEVELGPREADLPSVPPPTGTPLDAASILSALDDLEATFQTPLMLFYLGDFAYQEIADLLGIPMGTVKSRLARGVEQLQRRLESPRPPVEASKPSA
jgi:RNA polymerase sigma-70 factor (ECF subfamily)